MENIVYVKLMSGRVIPFDIPKDSERYTLLELSSDLNNFLKQEENIFEMDDIDDIDDIEDISNRILFFNNNFEKLGRHDLVINGSIYNVLINDLTVRVYFDRTIRLEHNYNEIPRKGLLEINLNSQAYRYIYKEIEYLHNNEEFHMYGRELIYNYDYDPTKFENVLKKYNLSLINDSDFTNISEETKITLIIAYFRECLCIPMIVTGYTFL
jgi:hypothetical protein